MAGGNGRIPQDSVGFEMTCGTCNHDDVHKEFHSGKVNCQHTGCKCKRLTPPIEPRPKRVTCPGTNFVANHRSDRSSFGECWACGERVFLRGDGRPYEHECDEALVDV